MCSTINYKGNANENHSVILLHNHWFGYHKIELMTNVEDVGKSEPSYTAGGHVKGAAMVEHSLTVPQTVKHRVNI